MLTRVRDRVRISQNRHKKKLRAEEKAIGVVPDWKTCYSKYFPRRKCRGRATRNWFPEKSRKILEEEPKDIRLKTMKKLKDTQQRQSDGMEDNQSNRPR